MDWAAAIERNSEALRGIVAAVFALLEAAGGASVARLPRPLHRAVLGVLRPAESAVRRLIVIAARDVAAKPASLRPPPARVIARGGSHRPTFQLFDPRRRVAPPRPAPGAAPRIHIFGSDRRIPALWPAPPAAAPLSPPEDGGIEARRVVSRLQAIKLALDDLPRQALRLARLRARRERVRASRFRSPLRPGRPPGHRSRWVHDVDRVLAQCHALAREALAADTS